MDSRILTQELSAGQAETGVQMRNTTVSAEEWKPAHFENSWQNYDPSNKTFNQPGYMKDSTGFIHLRGLIKPGKGSKQMSTVFTLEEGYRPQRKQVLLVLTGDQKSGEMRLGRIDVDKNGAVSGTFYGDDWNSLDGLIFYPGV